MPSRNPAIIPHRTDPWPLALFVAAALLRFSYLTEIEHNVDQAYPIWQALRTLEHGLLPLVGQGTSVLFANPALTGYLYLPFVAVTRSPLGAYLLVIALNSLAVPLAYRAIRALLGQRAGLIAAALMAVNPWVIEYSRSTWVQSLLPFFTCALAWLLWPVLLKRSRQPGKRLLAALIVLTLMTQTYLLAFLMIVPVGLLLLIYWRRVPPGPLVTGGVIFAAAALIYGAGLLAQADRVQQDVSDFASAPAQFSLEAWNHAARLVSGSDYPLARGQTAPTGDWEQRETLTRMAHFIILALLLTGMGLAFNALRTPRKRDPALILLIWFGVPVLLMSYVGQRVHPFYLLLTLPAGYALAGWALTVIPVIRRRAVTAALLVPFSILMLVNSQRFAQETAATPGAHDLGALPLDYGIQLGRIITAHLPPGGMVYAEVDEWTLNSLAGTTFPLLRDTRAPGFSIVPRGGGVYVFPHAHLPPDWIGPAFTTDHQQIHLPDGMVLTVDAYPPNAAQQIAPQRPLEITSEESLTLIGTDWVESDSSITLTTYWRVNAVSAETESWFFAPFVQVVNAAGEQVGVVEGAPVPGREWRAGDVHVHQTTLPAETSSVRIGQFDSTRQRNMIFLPDYTPLIPIPLD